MVQTGTLLGPLVRLVSPKMELYNDAGDSNPLLQPELDGLHVKQTQLKYRRSCCHKAQHSLASFKQTGNNFLEGGRVALNCHGSLR